MADKLATPEDLASYLQQDVDTSTATLALEVATGLIQKTTGQRWVTVTGDTVTLTGYSLSLWLPQTPVTAVTSVTTVEYGVSTLLTSGAYTLVGSRLDWAGYGVWPAAVTVVYSHGYASNVIPQHLRGVCISVAGRLYNNPQGLRSSTVGSVSETYVVADISGAVLTPVEVQMLGPSLVVV